MTEWINITATARAMKGAPGQEVSASPDDIVSIGKQIAADAVFGSFLEFSSSYWQDKLTASPSDFATAEGTPEEAPKFRIALRVNAAQYQMDRGGLQHLLGVLAGDLFFLRIPGFNITDFRVTDVELPPSSVADLEGHFRKEAHSNDRIRDAFRLSDREPLMAFSIKPRVGLQREALREIVLGVLDAGFQIVEFDTRYLHLDDGNMDFLTQLASEAAEVGGSKRITRLSPNLSAASGLSVEAFKKFKSSSEWPYVVKVDGGFDGFSTIQALRQSFTGNEAPIITCYPLLRDQMDSRIPRDFFIGALALCGVDVIYPGFSPSVGGGTRQLGAAERDSVVAATDRYAKLMKKGWPLLTLAGGVYAGQLHCLYELVGPSAAFFLGGAVSLHKQGPLKGADLCIRVVKKAADLHTRDAKHLKDLPEKLVEEVEAAYENPPGAPKGTFAYCSPKDFLAQVNVARW